MSSIDSERGGIKKYFEQYGRNWNWHKNLKPNALALYSIVTFNDSRIEMNKVQKKKKS